MTTYSPRKVGMIAVLLLGLGFSFGCPRSLHAEDKPSATALHPYFHKTEQPKPAHWSYSGDTGPEHWGELDPSYVLAKTGKHQSPIDIRGAEKKDLPKLHFDYKPSKINLVYNGHSVQENEDAGSVVMAAGNAFELHQFHFHSPSEHTVDGEHHPMEMHFVHSAADGTNAVVAVFIDEGEHNEAFDPVWELLPDADHPTRTSNVTIDAGTLLPREHGYYLYDGSLTTPPCTEPVKWAVLTTPIHLSKTQIERFRQVINHNNRPTQPLRGRHIGRSN